VTVVGASALISGLMRLLMSLLPGRTLAQLTQHRAHRFAEYDIYGLAAGLATSWAVLAASRPDESSGPFARDVVGDCVGALREVRPHAYATLQAALCRPLHTRPRPAQAVGKWCRADASDAWGEAATPRSAVLSQ